MNVYDDIGNYVGDADVESIESQQPKLSHPTADRPRAPSRRPPTSHQNTAAVTADTVCRLLLLGDTTVSRHWPIFFMFCFCCCSCAIVYQKFMNVISYTTLVGILANLW